jgi:ABC-type uncharacterized transport system substrate-binding protein
MLRTTDYYWVVLVVLGLWGVLPHTTQAAPCNVLVVMSYGETYVWEQHIREGIESVLADICELTYVYLHTRVDFEGGDQKAKEAYLLYQELQPDGVIAADDNVQAMFVVPYLKDRVETPVMFCGVNAEPEDYGYPASNVSGILERLHIKESLAFAQQLVPSITTFGFIDKDDPASWALIRQIQREADTYPATFVDFKLAKTLQDLMMMTAVLVEQCDALYMSGLDGILDDDGKPVPQQEAFALVAKMFGKPTLAGNPENVSFGALCAVVQSGQEQGRTAAKMLLQAMQGTPMSQIPITRNRQGNKIVNVTVMQALGITPNPEVLIGVELVKTEE